MVSSADYRLMSIIEYIRDYADDVLQEEPSESRSGALVACAEALTIIQEQLTEEKRKQFKLDFDVDARYI